MKKLIIRSSIRGTQDKPAEYVEAILEEFSPLWVKQYKKQCSTPRKIEGIEFMKQNSPYGEPSISIVDDRGVPSSERHFATYKEMMVFIEGYLTAHRKYI